MKSLNVGVESWIIQDGNYSDFTVGQKVEFALEFYPHLLKSSERRTCSAIPLNPSKYQICGQVVYLTKNVWVIDLGFLCYQEGKPPKYISKGSWVEGEVYIGIDHFAYFEELKNLAGMPVLTYNFLIAQIFLETTPWRTKTDETGRKMMVRNDGNESYGERAETDAWNDDNGNAHYILECIPIDGRVRLG